MSHQITALTKCELDVVQSARESEPRLVNCPPPNLQPLLVVGSILNKSCKPSVVPLSVFVHFVAVLVLGMCFFAGGLRFSEQGFGLSMCLSIALSPTLMET